MKMKSNLKGIFLAGTTLLVACNPGEEKIKNDLPNVVFIMADDMGYGDPGCYNPESKIPTPNIDYLAQKGMMFTNAHSADAVCTPSRYALLTGRYCWRTSLKSRGINTSKPLIIDTARTTVADLFKAKNYNTAIIGKWHLGLGSVEPVDYFSELKPGPLELGFDYFFGMPGSLNMTPFCFIENYRTVGIPDIPKPDSIYGTPGLMVEGWRHEDVGPTLIKKAVEFIQKQAESESQNPFYLHLLTSSPHRPCRPPDFIKERSQAGKRGDMVAEFDWTVGEVIKALEENGFLENTMIIVTSDNGAIPGDQEDDGASYSDVWEMFDHSPSLNWRGFKTQIWEGGHRVPFIAYWKRKIKEGSVSDQLICLSDWFSSVGELLEIDPGSNSGEDSFSFLPLLLESKATSESRESLVTHSMLGTFAIVKDNWKLIEGTDGGGEIERVFEPVDLEGNPPGQLYNLNIDPGEKDNLWNENPEKAEELLILLDEIRNSGSSK
jgi:arylsulfatase A